VTRLPSPERIIAIIANICRVFCVLPGDVGELTEFQIYAILFHATEKDGSIPIPDGGMGLTMPPGPASLSQEMALLDMLLAMPGARVKGRKKGKRITPADRAAEVAEMRAKLTAAHERKAAARAKAEADGKS